MSKRRFQRQQTMRIENQISQSRQNTKSRTDRWWMIGVLTTASIVGGVIGYVSLPANLDEGAHFFIALLGMVVFLFLGGMLIAGINRVRDKRQSLPLFLGWSAIVLTSAILGYFFFSSTMLVPIRIFLGTCIGFIGMYLLIALIANPQRFFGEIIGGFVDDLLSGIVEEGCCLGFVVLFIAITGTISSLLISHSVLLSVFIGGGSALVVLVALVALAFASRKCKQHENITTIIS